VYHATPIASKPEQEPEVENVTKKPRLEYLPLPIAKPTATYRATAINKKEDSNFYVPKDKELTAPSATYKATKISRLDADEKRSEGQDALETILSNDQEKDISASGGSENKPEVSPSDTNDKNLSSKVKVKDIKEREKHSKSSSSKHRSSSSSSSKKPSSSSSSSSRHHTSSRRDSSSSSSSHKHKSKSHKSSSHRSSSKSSSSSSHKRSSSDKKEKEPKEKVKEPEPEEDIMDFSQLPSSDDDIEEQCRQIFENYTPDKPEPAAIETKHLQKEDSDSEPTVVDKKRRAHDNASSVARQPATPKINHAQSALITAQRRQDMALHKAMSEVRAKDELIAKLEAEIKEKEEEKKKASLTPLINPIALYRPPPKRIAPITHQMAIEAAKRKVAEINRARAAQFQRSTPSQTAQKTSGRVAHVPTTVLNDVDPCKLAPPIKEPHNTKISSNIRNQYYQIMVKHCVEIYALPADAFERAQNEEFTVFQKCKMVPTYKTSALLAINRLKREMESKGAEKNAKTFSHDVMLAGKMGQKSSWSTNHKVKVADSDSSLVTIDNCSSSQAFNLFLECILTEKQLKENGFPRPTESRGRAQLFTTKKAKPQNGKEGDFYCARCHKVFNVEIYDEHHVDLCNFHLKRSGFRRGEIQPVWLIKSNSVQNLFLRVF
jgi:RNA exonuclease 1